MFGAGDSSGLRHFVSSCRWGVNSYVVVMFTTCNPWFDKLF